MLKRIWLWIKGFFRWGGHHISTQEKYLIETVRLSEVIHKCPECGRYHFKDGDC